MHSLQIKVKKKIYNSYFCLINIYYKFLINQYHYDYKRIFESSPINTYFHFFLNIDYVEFF